MSKNLIIDKCVEFIEDRDCHYLAKDGKMVYFASVTGRKSDYMWHQLSLAEAIRIISAIKLTPFMANRISSDHLVAAFQELGRVYEFAVKSRHKVSPEIFNYMEHSKETMGESIMAMIVDELVGLNMNALYLVEVLRLFDRCQEKIKTDIVGASEARELMYKYFEASGYEVKVGSRRVLINGKKTPVIIKPNVKPATTRDLTSKVFDGIVDSVWRELK